ncbi:cryptochrome/photolyase family protein [Thermostichus vulcanus]|uniref:Deoxyribodipyrimidine photo-lyase n=1 Tax=Thermostichus vulcanus str. 'Rupite' TaxID=2813851 RepID=A0ABT0CF47_THEVL|nr:deoxyribodipyrimidine photo-lyase [Thermostichus vulcanus]MCJ2544403.1 deoxyribodipyrimidine photo-lyase [Thermostichus vulcanus str. 'Rupite']
MVSPVLLWHRRDLRLQDNAALHEAARYSSQVVPVFIFDRQILERADTAPARVAFLLEALERLQEGYRQLGLTLLWQIGDPLVELQHLAATLGAKAVFWNEDVEPFARQRDSRVRAGLAEAGIQCFSGQDMLLHGPGEVLTQAGDPYSVFTPFWRRWRSLPKRDPYPIPKALQPVPSLQAQPLPSLADLGFVCTQAIPAAGEAAAQALLEDFCDGLRILDYERSRNFPAEEGTSRLSPHLRWGTVGIRQVWQATVAVEAEIRSEEAEASLQTWRQELCWREFYKHVLAHWPHVETSSYRKAFDGLEWENRQDRFQAWCEGQTGYPIVDAAMRQLNETGWMHNRCRMIVASFLTKDLLIDWRWGERYFMQKLVDGDLAANNGGWQWSAGVGTDPKPLRIFNPATQAARYDPEGEYIRRYVPELAGLDTPALLLVGDDQKGSWALQERRACGYPDPIVNHKVQQQEFKRRYQAVQGSCSSG